jgi:PAS domain S-box-containing protein
MGTTAVALLQRQGFLPHGYCIAWDPGLAALHVGSDALIALSYYSIPLTLLYFLAQRPLQRYRWVVMLFAGFIMACGTTHVMGIVTLWEPYYWAEGMVKAATAGVSIATAVMIWPLAPRLATLPLPAELDAVNARLQAEIAERRRLEAHFRTVVDAAPNALLMVNPEGRITLANEQAVRWFGYGREELLGLSVERLVPERLRPSHREHRGAYLDAPVVRPMGTGRDLYGLRQDGSEFPVDISLSPVDTQDGTQVIAAISDVTNHRRVKEELSRTNASLELVNRELESFAYSVSHDLRAPLRAMTGFARIVATDYAARLDETGQDYLGRIQAAAQRMGHLIDDLLALSRVTRGELKREPLDLSSLATRIAGELQGAEPARTATFHLEPRLQVEADPRLLEVLLRNLLDNAWKFTAKEPQARIELGCLRNGTQREFFVRDNGAGFDMAYADKLFGAFQRLHRQQDFPGTGIGLATVQRIVARHGGRIRAEGAPGAGATFFFTL